MQVRLMLHANDPIINRKTRLLNFVEAVSIIVLRKLFFVTVSVFFLFFIHFTVHCSGINCRISAIFPQQVLCIIL